MPKDLRHHFLGNRRAKRKFSVDDGLAQPQHDPLRQRFLRIELQRFHGRFDDLSGIEQMIRIEGPSSAYASARAFSENTTGQQKRSSLNWSQ